MLLSSQSLTFWNKVFSPLPVHAHVGFRNRLPLLVLFSLYRSTLPVVGRLLYLICPFHSGILLQSGRHVEVFFGASSRRT